jgi:hypothetical protein
MQDLHGLPQAHEFIQQIPCRQFTIPVWFRELIKRGREYTRNNGELEFIPLPETAQEWRKAYAHKRNEQAPDAGVDIDAYIEEELLNEFETAGLDEASLLDSGVEEDGEFE